MFQEVAIYISYQCKSDSATVDKCLFKIFLTVIEVGFNVVYCLI